jgi:hypothetical protein
VNDELERVSPGRGSNRTPPETILYLTMLNNNGFQCCGWKRPWVNFKYNPRLTLTDVRKFTNPLQLIINGLCDENQIRNFHNTEQEW